MYIPSAHLEARCIRFHLLPTLQTAIHSRLASTATSPPFPFPTHRHPKPHEIFHLAQGSSQAEIKSRYIDLVRVHHPDSVLCKDVPPHERQARFQAISAAYDHLRGKSAYKSPSHHWSSYNYNDRFNEELARRARDRRREFSGTAYDPAKDVGPALFPIMLVGGIVFILGILPALSASRDDKHHSAAVNLASAREEAKIFGQERRREIRKQARKYELAREEAMCRRNSCLNVGLPKDES